MTVVSMNYLLEAGVHFGHQKRRWNPKMREYIYTSRDDIYIIDLQKTSQKIDEAYVAMKEMCYVLQHDYLRVYVKSSTFAPQMQF